MLHSPHPPALKDSMAHKAKMDKILADDGASSKRLSEVRKKNAEMLGKSGEKGSSREAAADYIGSSGSSSSSSSSVSSSSSSLSNTNASNGESDAADGVESSSSSAAGSANSSANVVAERVEKDEGDSGAEGLTGGSEKEAENIHVESKPSATEESNEEAKQDSEDNQESKGINRESAAINQESEAINQESQASKETGNDEITVKEKVEGGAPAAKRKSGEANLKTSDEIESQEGAGVPLLASPARKRAKYD
jgi:hypothetical protein